MHSESLRKFQRARRQFTAGGVQICRAHFDHSSSGFTFGSVARDVINDLNSVALNANNQCWIVQTRCNTCSVFGGQIPVSPQIVKFVLGTNGETSCVSTQKFTTSRHQTEVCLNLEDTHCEQRLHQHDSNTVAVHHVRIS